MNLTPKSLTLFIAVLTLPVAAFAQNEEASTMLVANSLTSSDTVVIDDKSLSQLRREVFHAEEEFYSTFNDLNDDKDFNVRCFYEKPTGSHIKNHVCRARFVTKAFSKNASRGRNDLSRVANQDADPAFEEKTAQYQEKMETLIAANPDLEAALIRYNTVRAQFMTVREGS
jgi:hypothetical protein